MSAHLSSDPSVSRRDFVSVLGAAWIAGSIACSRDTPGTAKATPAPTPVMGRKDDAAPPTTLAHFSAAQGAEIEAIASRILPSDDGPGAKEAGVLYFIDHGLTTFAKDQAKIVDDGLVSLSQAVAKAHKGETRFSALTPEQQDAMLRSVEKTPFFGVLRFATIAGFLALPKYGGNRDFVGWKYIGQDNVMENKPPFGWYDRPENQMAVLGRII